jgi:hypothetical protein
MKMKMASVQKNTGTNQSETITLYPGHAEDENYR